MRCSDHDDQECLTALRTQKRVARNLEDTRVYRIEEASGERLGGYVQIQFVGDTEKYWTYRDCLKQ
jgi:hypothetical protein